MPQSRFLSILVLALLSAEAHSLGIGEIVSQPRLGEHLRIEVRLLTDGQSLIDPACIQLAPGDNADDLPWVRGARLHLQRGPRPTLIIESNEAVNHPIYLLGLRLSCGVEVRREFTLMPQAPVELPAASSPIPANSPNALPDAAATPADAARLGGWTTVEGETLAGIASALFPNDSASQKRFIREAARSNPRLFRGVADAAQHPLPAGESLALPGSDTRRADRPAPRPRFTKSSPPRRPSASRATHDADASPAILPRSTPLPRRSEDRLSVASSSDGESGLRFSTLLDDARSRGLTEEQRERLRQEQRLIAELDEKIIASLALAEKIRKMEGYLEKLQGDMAQLDQRIQNTKSNTMAGSSAPPAAQTVGPGASTVATKAAIEHPPAEDSIPWLYLLLAAVAAVVGWLWWRRRRPDEAVYPGSSEGEATEQESQPEASTHHDAVAATPPTQWAPATESLSLELEDRHDQDNRIGVAEHDSALELAEIMLSFGRVQGAAQTLTDYIHANPRQAIRPWLKLFEVYHDAGMRAEFEALVEQFHRNFNVQKITWDDYTHDLARASLEDLPHVVQEVVSSWGSPACLSLLQGHLHDNREGTRMGFPLGVADDIATLVALLEARLEARPAVPAQAAAA